MIQALTTKLNNLGPDDQMDSKAIGSALYGEADQPLQRN